MNTDNPNVNREIFSRCHFGIATWQASLSVAAALLVIAFSGPLATSAHEQIASVIVDTDMALDDARALAMLLTAHELDVKAIVTSDGSAPPKIGATNVLRILHFLGRSGIPVGAGRTQTKPAPPWAERSITLGWTDLPLPRNSTVTDATTLLNQTFDCCTNRFVWVCLGPLSNLAELMKNRPELTNRLSRVFYSGGDPVGLDPGWNTRRDPEAARAVFNSGVEIVAIQLPAEHALVFDSELYEQIKRLDTPAAKLIARLHAHPNVHELLTANHFRAWDETVVLMLLEPSIGLLQRLSNRPNTSVLAQFDVARARTAYIGALAHEIHAALNRRLVVFNRFPVNPELFQPDVQPLVTQIINRYGAEEWALAVLTSELHGHLGIYSVLGAKMGLRAREVLGAGLDELHVESFAGSQPPLSCLNDGLQVATGATLGHGTIRLAHTAKPEPAAVFYLKNRKLRMSVKEEPLRRVKDAIHAAAITHGDQTPAYFHAVRRIALELWRDFDRKKIFDETIETGTEPVQN